jgi:HSP20 family protein
MSLLRHETVRPAASALSPFDRLFEEWRSMLPTRWATMPMDDVLRVDELRENGDLVIRAEMAGVDPAKDVEITVSDGMLHISAERHSDEKSEESGYVRRELRYGSFHRSLPLPKGVTDDDVKATYKDGILEIRVAMPAGPPEVEPRKVPITTA